MAKNIKISKKYTYGATGTGNLILEGDNLHSLSILAQTHSQSVDCIYIDPPYNTGNQHFVYKDRFKQNPLNQFQSEWLQFMEPRLRLCHKTLKEDGVIFLSIDDREIGAATVLLDSIFSRRNKIGVFCKRIKGGKNDSKFMRKGHEYLLVYGKSKKSISRLKGKSATSNVTTDQQLNKWGDNDRREDRPNLFYPIFVNETSGKLSTNKFPGSMAVLPIKSNGTDGCWRWSKKKVEAEKDRLLIKTRTNGKLGIYVKGGPSSNKEIPWDSIIDDFGTGGGEDIKAIFGDAKAFTYAKNIDYIKWIISHVKGSNLTILDFFAGSGTTAHAALELNKEDGRSRKFILCGNSEAADGESTKNICRDICAQRVKYAIKSTQLTGNGFDYFVVEHSSIGRRPSVGSAVSLLQISLGLDDSHQSPFTSRQLETLSAQFAGLSRRGEMYYVVPLPSAQGNKLPNVGKQSKVRILSVEEVQDQLKFDLEDVSIDVAA